MRRKITPLITRNFNELMKVLNVAPAAAMEIKIRSQLNEKIIQSARQLGLTHEQIARLAGTSRATVTKIINRNIGKVSTGLLFRILQTLGIEARISFQKSKLLA